MTIRNLEGFFTPRSAILIGPSRYQDAITRQILQALSGTQNTIPFYHTDLEEMPSCTSRSARRLEDMPEGPDLAVVLSPPQSVPGVITRLGNRACKAVLLLSPGYEAWPEDLLQKCREAARPFSIRLIGPGSLGIAVPALGMNTLLSADPPLPGDVAFIARSGAVLNATLSWAAGHRIGFSSVTSLGERTDVDIGDLIDYFAQDHKTRAILLHMESISNPRKFMSAARAAARSKPLIVIRSGRSFDPSGTGTTHSGRLADPDLVYEAAFRRAGMMRVDDLDEMFEAVETLSRIRVPRFKRLTILSNGRSLASLAADRLSDLDGKLAALSDDTLSSLSGYRRDHDAGRLPSEPVILREDLEPDALKTSIAKTLRDPATDGVLVLQSPTAFTDLESIASAIADAAKEDRIRTGRRKAIIAGLAGNDTSARRHLDKARVPCFGSPAETTRAAMHLARDAKARDFLMAAPPSISEDFTPDASAARSIVDTALKDNRSWLSPEDVHAVLSAYQIPIIATRLCQTPEEAAEHSKLYFETSAHCVVKLISPDLPFKSRIDGVRLGLEKPESVKRAAQSLIEKTRRLFPDARIAGVSLHPMLEDRHALELFAGLADTADFGPVLVFGHGGTSVEDNKDVSVELPPLDLNLAHALIERTRISTLIEGGSARPALDRDAIALTLVKLSQLSIDRPEILELDINPLIVRQDGLLAVDARITLGTPKQHPGRSGSSRLAIAPYPQELEETLTTKSGAKVFVRPVRPEDEDLFKRFFERIEPEDLRLRFFAPVREFSHRFLARLTQLDYARAMAFAAIDPATGDLLGVVRLHADPDHKAGEYAIMVRSDLKGTGLGWALMQLLIRYAHSDGIETIQGEVLKENTSMLAMCEALGFKTRTSSDDPGIAHVVLRVADVQDQAP